MEHQKRHALQKKGRIERSPLDFECVSGSKPKTSSKKYDEPEVISDLPAQLPVCNEEIGLLRAYLSAEINAILQGDDLE